MGIFKNVFGKSSSFTVSTSGVSFTDASVQTIEDNSIDSNLNLSTVYACINVKSSAISTMPVAIYKREGAGKIEVVNHSMSQLLKNRPNRYMSKDMFFKTIIVHKNIHGFSLVYKEYQNGKIVGLHILDPNDFQIILYKDPEKSILNKIFYQNIRTGEVFDEDEVLKFMYFSEDGITPKSPFDVIRNNTTIMKKQNNYLKNVYSNTTLTRGVLEVEGQVGKEAKDKIREEWEKVNSAGNEGKIAVLDSSMKFKDISINLADYEFLNSHRFNIEEICRAFNVPKHFIQDTSSTNFSTSEQMHLNFYQNTLLSEINCLEQEMNYKLFTTKEIEEGYYIKFNFNHILRADAVAQANYFKIMLDSGVYSINEVRDIIELNKIENGDSHYMSLNFVDVSFMEEYQKTKANPNNNPSVTSVKTFEGGEQ